MTEDFISGWLERQWLEQSNHKDLSIHTFSYLDIDGKLQYYNLTIDTVQLSLSKKGLKWFVYGRMQGGVNLRFTAKYTHGKLKFEVLPGARLTHEPADEPDVANAVRSNIKFHLKDLLAQKGIFVPLENNELA